MRGEIDALSGKTKQLDQQFKKVDGAYMRMDQRRQASNKIFKARIRALEESTSQRLKPVNMDQFMLDWSAAAECIYTKLGLFELVCSYSTAVSPTHTSPCPHDSDELPWRVKPQ